MLSLTNRDDIAGALNNRDLDVDLRALIGARAWQQYVEQNRPRAENIRIVVIEGGDPAEIINETLGFPVAGNDAQELGYGWIEDHGLWFEIAYARTGDLPTFIFVENGPATELSVHYLCLAYFWPDSEGEGR